MVVPRAWQVAPDPGSVTSPDDLVRALSELRGWAGDPSFASLAEAIESLRTRENRPGGRPGKVTVYDCFRIGRRRLDAILFLDLITVLGVPARAQEQWWWAYRVAFGRSDEDLTVPRPSGDSALWPPRTPLIGRDHELDTILQRAPGSMVMISGAPGSGKTELALHVVNRWHRLLAPKAAGLALDLRGFDPDLEPLAPLSVLSRLLLGVGVSPAGYEGLSLEDRMGLLVRVLAERPVVMLLDNAGSAEQVLPLLPVPPRWRIVVTSRRRFDSLEQLIGEPLVLGELSHAAALDLLGAGVGADRVHAEPKAARRIVERCGHIALDLTVVGAAIAAESDEWSLADHATRLEALPADEYVRPALQLSYAALPETLRRTLRLAALHPGPRFSASEVAALVDLAIPAVVGHLGQLAAEHLLTPVAEGFTMHDVVRSFALRQTLLTDPRSQQLLAVGRWVQQLTREVHAHAQPGRPDTAWLTEHLPVVVALVDGYADTELIADITELVVALIEYLDVSGQLGEAENLLRVLLRHPEVPNRRTVQRKLGRVLELRGNLNEAWDQLRDALDPADPEYGRALNGVGNVLKRMGRLPAAVHYYCLAVRDARLTDDCFAGGRALGNLADALRELGHLGWAEQFFEAGRECSERAGDRVNLAIMLSNRCELIEARGDFAEAAELVAEALPIYIELGFAALWVNAEGVRARCLLATGDLDGCEAALERAERQAQLSGIPEQRCDLAMIRSRMWLGRGDHHRAITELQDVVAQAQRLRLGAKASQAEDLLQELGH